MKLLSDEYRTLLRDRYTRKGWGASGYSHVKTVVALCEDVGARTVLDYGCGRGTFKRDMIPAEYDVREYDPGIIGKDELPNPADVVVCTDVLEHVEPECLTDVLAHLRALTLKAAFFTIALSPSKEVLADGRNAHLILEPTSWWADQLMTAGFHIARAERVKGLWLWLR